MIILRKLALALYLAFLSISYSNSQTVDPTTGNLINTGTTPTDTTSTWNNGVYVNQLCFYAGEPGNCGPNPSITNGGNINFSYGLTDLNQIININKALAAGGTGVQLSGFNFGFSAKNGNGWDGGQQDYLAAYVKLYGSGGNQIANYDYSSSTNQLYNWTNFKFSETFATPYVASTLSTAQVGFVGRDNNFWAGNYGPEIINVSFDLKYKVDPCATNPAYSSTCAGFGNILNTNNLLDSTKGGSSLNQAFAINTALQNAGVGATVHGFNYGFNWRVGQGFSGCTAWNQDGSCSWTMNIPAYANASFSLTNSSNQSIHSKPYSFTGEGTSGSVSDKYLLPSSMNQSLLGMGRITGSASGTGSSIEGAWATMIYTADPCVANPLHSSNCKGYAFAMAKQLSSSNNTSPIAFDGTQMQDPVQDPTRPPPPPGSQPPPPGSQPPPPGSEPPPGSQPPPPGSPPPPGATQTASSNSGNPPANQPPPQGGGSSQPKAGEVKTAGDSNSKSGPSLSSVMSMISSNQARIGNETKAVVQAAESAATQSATSAQQQAETVAGALTTQSIASSMTQSSTSTGVVSVSSGQTQTSVVNVASVSQTSVVNIGGLRPATQSIFADPSVSISSSMTQGQFDMYSLQAPPGLNKQPDVEIPQNEGIKIGGRSPLNDLMEQRSMVQNTTTQEQKTDAVNKNVQPNEVAGKVDIASMATQPTGYQAYSTMMPDVAFYAPKEIYKNQVNVDNARTLRGLQRGSDSLHQEMVNQQYRLGK
jgi:hypothetical protein